MENEIKREKLHRNLNEEQESNNHSILSNVEQDQLGTVFKKLAKHTRSNAQSLIEQEL